MKKLIFKKIFGDIGQFFLISTACVAVIVWIIQAVNFLDIISEDGHSLKVYFSYTLFSLPKIVSKIIPFIFMISVFYIIIKYELNNELIIYWINGITKINFINVIIKISFLFFILQVLFTTIIVPYTLDKGRSYFRDSNIDLFASIIKPKKFIDTVEDLTIFVEKKENNFLKNIMIKEKISENESQIIIAQNGEVVEGDNISKSIILNNGKIINTKDKNQNIIDFSKFNLDLSKFNTKSITHPKVQEMSSFNLIKCLKMIENLKNTNKNIFTSCNSEITDALVEEFLKRFFAPVFIILIGLTSSLLVFSNKDEKTFKFRNFFNFILGITIIIISEISLRYSGLNIKNMITYFFVPFIIFATIYLSVYLNHKNIRGN